jgi:Short C-terminal domain
MKLFRRNQNKDVEKPIITYYVKYIGALSSNKSYPLEEGADVHIYEDRVVVELLKSKFKTTIPYKNMIDIQNVNAGNKVDLDRVFGLGLLTGGVGSIVALLWKRHAILIVIKYSDDADTKATMSIADELSKLAKLKEQGVITEEEFSQMKNNLMKRI